MQHIKTSTLPLQNGKRAGRLFNFPDSVAESG